jgi:hypothetical protein
MTKSWRQTNPAPAVSTSNIIRHGVTVTGALVAAVLVLSVTSVAVTVWVAPEVPK